MNLPFGYTFDKGEFLPYNNVCILYNSIYGLKHLSL